MIQTSGAALERRVIARKHSKPTYMWGENGGASPRAAKFQDFPFRSEPQTTFNFEVTFAPNIDSPPTCDGARPRRMQWSLDKMISSSNKCPRGKTTHACRNQRTAIRKISLPWYVPSSTTAFFGEAMPYLQSASQNWRNSCTASALSNSSLLICCFYIL